MTATPVGREWSPLPADLPEASFMATVVELAQWRGWRSYHTFDSRRSAPGWPDVVLVRGDRMIAAELKTNRGRVSTAQAEWLAALSRIAGVECHIWRPDDWAAVQAALR